jgi:hypothetical protein
VLIRKQKSLEKHPVYVLPMQGGERRLRRTAISWLFADGLPCRWDECSGWGVRGGHMIESLISLWPQDDAVHTFALFGTKPASSLDFCTRRSFSHSVRLPVRVDIFWTTHSDSGGGKRALKAPRCIRLVRCCCCCCCCCCCRRRRIYRYTTTAAAITVNGHAAESATFGGKCFSGISFLQLVTLTLISGKYYTDKKD